MKLSAIATALGLPTPAHDVECKGVSTDTRTLQKGELFIALQGPTFDGHDFIEIAEAQGAAALIVSQSVVTDLPILEVDDTEKALWQLGEYQRDNLDAPLIAVTGSCGKTTTKNCLAHVFGKKGRVLASEQSYNNHIGVPLTLLESLKSKTQYDYVITELGTNGPKEIEPLAQLVKPDVAIITNVAPVHLERLGTLKGIAEEKGDIYRALSPKGIAIVNNDDAFADYWREIIGKRRTITFGVVNPADVMAREIRSGDLSQPTFELVLPNATATVRLQLIGEHNVYNALATAAAAYALGLDIEQIVSGLESTPAEEKRLIEQRNEEGVTIIDDSYNANPASVSAAMRVLRSREGKSILVLGDMLELGQDADRFHREIGAQAAELGVDRIFCFGELTKHTAEGFGPQAKHFSKRDSLIDELKSELAPDTTVLIKGSKAMKMWLVTTALME